FVAIQYVRGINTNRYVVAKVDGFRSDSSILLFDVDDGKRDYGRHTESFWLRDSALRVYTNKTLYRRGDALEVELRSTYERGPVILEVLRQQSIVKSKVLQLHNGKALTVIQY